MLYVFWNLPLSPSQTWKRMLRKTGDRSGSGSMPDRATRSGGRRETFARNRWALFCGRAEQEEGRQVEGHLQSLNLGEGLNVGHEGGIHRGSGAMIGQTLPGWADVCTLPLCKQHTQQHTMCKQHTQAALWLHFLYATGTHRVHWPTYSRGPSDGMPGLRVALDEHWRAP